MKQGREHSSFLFVVKLHHPQYAISYTNLILKVSRSVLLYDEGQRRVPTLYSSFLARQAMLKVLQVAFLKIRLYSSSSRSYTTVVSDYRTDHNEESEP